MSPDYGVNDVSGRSYRGHSLVNSFVGTLGIVTELFSAIFWERNKSGGFFESVWYG